MRSQRINIRKVLQVYHCNEIYDDDREVEVIKIKDLFNLLSKLKITKLHENEQFKSIFDLLEKVEAIKTHKTIGRKVIVLEKLI